MVFSGSDKAWRGPRDTLEVLGTPRFVGDAVAMNAILFHGMAASYVVSLGATSRP